MKLKKAIRNILCLSALCAVISVCPAHAAVGDIVDTIYTTDILTRVNGADIASFSIEGRTLIAMEDLRDYGFTVAYDDSIRTLFVNQTGETPKNMPSIIRGTVGGTAGYTYETDIKVIFNGKPVNAYAIDGKMAVIVEELGVPEKYGMVCGYDDGKRLLTLDSAAPAVTMTPAPTTAPTASAAPSKAPSPSPSPTATAKASGSGGFGTGGGGFGGGGGFHSGSSSGMPAPGAAPDSTANSALNVIVDGNETEAYISDEKVYLGIDALKAFGFDETYRDDNIIMLVKKRSGDRNPPVSDTSLKLTYKSGEPKVYVNGVPCDTMYAGDIPAIRVDDLKTLPFDENVPCCGLSAEKTADGSLIIDTTGSGYPTFDEQSSAVLSSGDMIIDMDRDFWLAQRKGKLYKILRNGHVVPITDLLTDYGIDMSAATDFSVSPDGHSLTWINHNDNKYYQFDLTDLIPVPVLNSNIRVRVNGADISAATLGCETFITLEDLSGYGFSVAYDDSINTMFVNQTESEPNPPQISAASYGGAEYGGEADITVVFNGVYIKAYNIGGKTAVKADILGGANQNGEYNYGLRYDRADGIIDINSLPAEPKEKQIEKFIDPENKFNWNHENTYSGTDFDLVICSQSGTPHGTFTTFRQFMDMGRSNNINNVFYYYGFNNTWGKTLIEITGMSGDKLYFTGERGGGRSGDYVMDLHSYIITPVSENEPDPDADFMQRFPTPESPIGKTAVAPEYPVEIDGVPVRAFEADGRVYISPYTLTEFGFEATYASDDMIILLKRGEGGKAPAETAEPGSEAGTMTAWGEPKIFVNGVAVSSVKIDGEPMMRIDDLSVEPFDFDGRVISAGIDARMCGGSLIIDTTMSGFPSFESQLEKVCSIYGETDFSGKIKKNYLYQGDEYSIIDYSNQFGNHDIYKVCSNGLVMPLSFIIEAYGVSAAAEPEVSGDGLTMTLTDNETGTEHTLDLINLTLDNA